MLKIGLTGGIGMGKTAVSDFLQLRGEPIIDTDVLARELVAPGQPALGEISRTFGTAMLRADGTLDRKALAEVVFANLEKRKILEAILHPRIRDAWKSWLRDRASESVRRSVVVIPLLFETAAEKELDLTICVASSLETQCDRLRARGWSEDEIARRAQAQMDIRQKMDLANRVVWNDSSLDVCHAQVDRIFASL